MNQDRRVPAGWHAGAGVLGLLSLLVWLVGCESTGSSTNNSHAALTIEGHSLTDVVVTTREVFQDRDYRLVGAETDRMIFERQGTRGEQVKYGSFGSSAVVMRVKVDLQEMGPESIFLRCNVYSVRDAGESVLEDETRILLARGKTFQDILEEIQTRLDAETS
jgi:hypothetical protein